jgi:quercetin dioxygenase-like cupin family protein
VSDDVRTINNPATGERITFLETAQETGGTRTVMMITLAPGGEVSAHSHRAREHFEIVDGSFVVDHAGQSLNLTAGQQLVVAPDQMHGFRNATDTPATLKVTVTPSGGIDAAMRTLSGLARDGRLVPGRRPKDPLVLAVLACRGHYYSPPLPRWIYWPLMKGLAGIGGAKADQVIAGYNQVDQ